MFTIYSEHRTLYSVNCVYYVCCIPPTRVNPLLLSPIHIIATRISSMPLVRTRRTSYGVYCITCLIVAIRVQWMLNFYHTINVRRTLYAVVHFGLLRFCNFRYLTHSCNYYKTRVALMVSVPLAQIRSLAKAVSLDDSPSKVNRLLEVTQATVWRHCLTRFQLTTRMRVCTRVCAYVRRILYVLLIRVCM